MLRFLSIIVVTFIVATSFIACDRNKTPVTTTTISSAIFHSDKFHLSVNVPEGWRIAEGPKYLAKPFEGQVAFNSWGQENFWTGEVQNGNSFTYSVGTVMSQVPEGGAYMALVRIEGPPRAPNDVPGEYTSNDLSGLYKPHDWRLEASQGAQFINFFKWNTDLRLEIACRATASDVTVAKLNYLLQNWRFDAIPPGK